MFTPEQQKDHRLTLARHLSRNVKDSVYNHNRYKACALGRAAKLGIGGLSYEQSKGCSDGQVFLPNVENGSLLLYGSAADYVFGKDSYEAIFNSYNKLTRKEVIKALREFNGA